MAQKLCVFRTKQSPPLPPNPAHAVSTSKPFASSKTVTIPPARPAMPSCAVLPTEQFLLGDSRRYP